MEWKDRRGSAGEVVEEERWKGTVVVVEEMSSW